MYTRLLKIKNSSKKSFFLFGPRGTGKTFWVKQNFPECFYIDLLETDLYTDLLSRPQRLEGIIPAGFKDWIIIDEVQKIPELLNEVHRLIEKSHYKFVLTGSSARSLRRKGINLLAGRALYYHMHPLTSVELGKDFDLKRVLKFGHLPAVLSEENPLQYLNTYVKVYLREEVLQEGLTRNLSAFSRFLEVASFSQGAQINISALARETGIHQKVATSYFEIVEDLLLGYRLSVFTKRAQRRLVAHEKFYFFDVGVYRAIRPMGPMDTIAEIDGPALETLYLQELKALNDSLQWGYNFYYWRTSEGHEVDFVLYGPRGFYAIEIKRSERWGENDLRGLRAFSKDYPVAKLYFVCGTKRKEHIEKITIISHIAAFKEFADLF